MTPVLCTRPDSVYRELGADCYDIERDARTYRGELPVVAHPPCRAWASLRHHAKPRVGEKELALFCVDTVRRVGGVLEHPSLSTLWQAAALPRGLETDPFGGHTLIVDQFWFGHRARKRTALYIVGVCRTRIPRIPLALGEAPCTVGLWSGRDRRTARPSIAKAEFEATPRNFAAWLLELAQAVRV